MPTQNATWATMYSSLFAESADRTLDLSMRGYLVRRRQEVILFLAFVLFRRRMVGPPCGSRGGPFLGTRGRQDVTQSVVALMTRVLERPLIIGHLRQIHRE